MFYMKQTDKSSIEKKSEAVLKNFSKTDEQIFDVAIKKNCRLIFFFLNCFFHEVSVLFEAFETWKPVCTK